MSISEVRSAYYSPCLAAVEDNSSKPDTSIVPGEDAADVWCNAAWDSVSCWPPTPAGLVASVPCPSFFAGIPIDFSENATRICHRNGTWQTRADYSDCLPLLTTDLTDSSSDWNVVYCSGFMLSMATLSISLFIFIRFKNLRCMRNSIHCHLIVSFIVRMGAWMVIYFGVPSIEYESERSAIRLFCKAVVVLFNYAQATNFFWMLVEGLYLHTMIVCPFAASARVRLWHYALIGWGVPVVIVSSWATHKASAEDEICWLPRVSGPYEFILIVPILCVLFVNLLILANVVYVLVTKLRDSKNLQTVQYRVAVKSTVVLLPLLGLTYLFLLIDPGRESVVQKTIALINAFLQSTQGFFVSLFYCLLNGEVKSTVRTWAKNLMGECGVRTVTPDAMCCLFCRPRGHKGGGGGGGGGGEGGGVPRRTMAASSVTELTKQDIELQTTTRHSLTLVY